MLHRNLSKASAAFADGFRYVAIRGLPAGYTVTEDTLTAHFVHSDLAKTGFLELPEVAAAGTGTPNVLNEIYHSTLCAQMSQVSNETLVTRSNASNLRIDSCASCGLYLPTAHNERSVRVFALLLPVSSSSALLLPASSSSPLLSFFGSRFLVFSLIVLGLGSGGWMGDAHMSSSGLMFSMDAQVGDDMSPIRGRLIPLFHFDHFWNDRTTYVLRSPSTPTSCRISTTTK